MNLIAEFFVPGKPATAGSKRAFAPKGGGRPVVVEDCKRSRAWRSDVVTAARAAYDGPPVREAITLSVHFWMPRPKSHYRGTSGVLRPEALHYHATKPDATKLLRAVEDALTGLVWVDDAQIAFQLVLKAYSDNGRIGAYVMVTTT